jgi:tetratricopeptide (TPR) repeat protein
MKLAEIGRELGVSHVLEGSVRKSGNQIRVTAQLVNVDDDTHIWSDTWDREFQNVFQIQDEIAAAVVSALRIQLVDNLPHAYVTDMESYALYLRASELATDYSKSSFEEADSLLKRVIENDPDYGPALIELSEINYVLGTWGYRPRRESAEFARRYARRALSGNPGLAEAYVLLASIAGAEEHDWASEKMFIEQALAIDPNNLQARRLGASLLLMYGDTGPNLEVTREWVKVDPLSAGAFRELGHALKFAGQYDEAIEAFRKVQKHNPGSIVGHTDLGIALTHAGMYDEALVEFEQEPIEEFRYFGRAVVHHYLGNNAQSNSAIEALIGVNDDSWAAQIAQVHAVRGEIDSALLWLNRGYELYDIGVNIAPIDPFLKNLHGDPRFDAFLARLRSGVH